jgi:hypothetical protein
LAPLGAVQAVLMQFSMIFLLTGLSEKFLMVRRVDRFSKKIRDRNCISFDEYPGRGDRGICWSLSINFVY